MIDYCKDVVEPELLAVGIDSAEEQGDPCADIGMVRGKGQGLHDEEQGA